MFDGDRTIGHKLNLNVKYVGRYLEIFFSPIKNIKIDKKIVANINIEKNFLHKSSPKKHPKASEHR